MLICRYSFTRLNVISTFCGLSITVFSQSNKKNRLFFYLRAVNEHLWKQSVKFEDMWTVRQHIKLKSSMLAFDINIAYHHVHIYEPHI